MQMSLGLSRGARKSERVTVLMYEGSRAFLCIRCVAMDHCARVRLCIRVQKKEMSLAAFYRRGRVSVEITSA